MRFFARRDYAIASHPASRLADSIIPGNDNCMDEDAAASSSLSFTAYPWDRPCDEIVVEVSGGVAPYTVSVLAAQSGAFWNLTDVDDDRINMRNLVPAGQTYHRASAFPDVPPKNPAAHPHFRSLVQSLSQTPTALSRPSLRHGRRS